MTPDTELTEEQRGVLGKVEKLLRLADLKSNSSPEEAASATQKAQELLLAYNLSADMVGEGSETGRRGEEKLRGGFYQYQQDLWQAVAELNFCMYFSSGHWVERSVRYKHWSGEMRTETRGKWEKIHRLIGRLHNVKATVAMSNYLEGAIERLVEERIHGQNNLRFSKFATSYREGAVYDISKRINARRREQVREERTKQREAEERAKEAAAKGASTSTAVTIASLTRSEREANADFIWGKKTMDEVRALQAEKARAAAAAEQEYTRWAAENPEEARAEEVKREAEQEARAAKNAAKTEKLSNAFWAKKDMGAFLAGEEAASKIGLDPQADTDKPAGSLG